MIYTPSTEHLRELCELSAAPDLRLGRYVRVNEMDLGRLSQGMRMIAQGKPWLTAVVEAATLAVGGIESMLPVENSSNERLALLILRDLMSGNNVILDPPLTVRDLEGFAGAPLTDATIDGVRRRIESRLVRYDQLVSWTDIESSLELGDCRYEAFIGCAMTGVPDVELEDLERATSAVADRLAANRICSYPPVVLFNPSRLPIVASSPRQHDEDIARLVRADLFIAIVDRGSIGLGIAIAQAARTHALQLIFVRGPAGSSPLLVGTTADAEFHEYRSVEQVLRVVDDFIRRRTVDLEVRRAIRLQRTARYGPLLNSLREGLTAPGIEDSLVGGSPVSVSNARLREILSGVDYIAGASVEEIDALADFLGLGRLRLGEQLSMRQLRALLEAQDAFDWSDQSTGFLLESARLELAKPATRRLDLATIEGWAAFFEHLRER